MPLIRLTTAYSDIFSCPEGVTVSNQACNKSENILLNIWSSYGTTMYFWEKNGWAVRCQTVRNPLPAESAY